MKINKLYLLALTLLFVFSSCSTDDDPGTRPIEQGDYNSGIFVLNEGVFNQGNSTVSFIDDQGNVTNNIFSTVNAGALGDTGQSIGLFEDYAFIVVNVSNKIEVVDRYTFESIATINEGLDNPRYVAFSNGNAYVTNWGDGNDPNDDFIAVIDMADLSIKDNIGVLNGPENIVAQDGLLYVAHGGGYTATDNDKISVINAATNNLAEIISVGNGPNGLQIENGHLWVSSGGVPAWTGNEAAGQISRVDLGTYEVVKEYGIPDVTFHPANLNVEEGVVYYTLGKEVYAFNTNDESLPEAPHLILEEVISLYGFEVKDSRIYAASATADYSGNGTVYVYDAVSTDLLEEYEVGINPNGIYFNN